MKQTAKQFKFHSQVWLYPSATAAWHFVGVPRKETVEIDKRFGTKKRGWGSLPVEVTVGKTTWLTSIFPDSKSRTYILPLKASVRRAEGIFDKDHITLQIQILI